MAIDIQMNFGLLIIGYKSYIESFIKIHKLRTNLRALQHGYSSILGAPQKMSYWNDTKCSHESIFSSPEPWLIGELIGYPWIRRPSVVVNNFKHLLLRNRWADQSQILCGASLGRGNDILLAASGSHDQDGRHAHIW